MTQHRMEQLAAAAAAHATGLQTATAIPRFTIWSSDGPSEATPALFVPKFYIVLQGAKCLTVGGRPRAFVAGDCAVSSIPLPFTTQVTEASTTLPYVGVELRFDASVAADLLLGMPDVADRAAPTYAFGHANEEVLETIERLLRLLDKPAEIPVLGPQYVRELTYRLLQGPMGPTLGQIVTTSARFEQVRAAVAWICEHANEAICVKSIAASVGMSVTSFHRHFKAVTTQSPLAYQRHLRLLDAKRLLTSGATNVTSAAFATGYASASQFSREYKRMFGVAPVRDAVAFQQAAPSGLNGVRSLGALRLVAC